MEDNDERRTFGKRVGKIELRLQSTWIGSEVAERRKASRRNETRDARISLRAQRCKARNRI